MQFLFIISPLTTIFLFLLAGNLLAPGDKIRIYLWPDTMISGEYRVQEDGSCYLPILGKVTVEGKEHEKLRAELEEAYGAYYQNPQLTLEPLYRVYVTGEVFGPREYYITGSETIMEIVAMAGGPTPSGDMGRTQLIKKKTSSRVDLNAAMKNGQTAVDAGIESGDIIYVPRTFLAKWGGWPTIFSIVATAISVGISLYLLLNR